jgi:mono/diheme cytochrome c family protein
MCLVLGATQLPESLRAHPLQAEPINHPYVYTFDQFHLAEDGDESLIEGGLLLMAETNCAACHEVPKDWQERLAPRPGPDLSGIGSRLDADTLWLLVRSPQHRKKGTLMPGMFTGADGDAEKVEALTEYLLTLKQEVKPAMAGDAANGKQLYHTVGCVACHEPATDYRPPSVPEDHDVEKPGNASNPIALADAYDVQALTRFLQNPHEFRPAGRMPSMHLTEKEAADIAAYLHIGRTAEKAVERALLRIAPQTAELGRQLFVEQRCSICHTTNEVQQKRPASPLTQLRGNGGCIAEQPKADTPRFDFNPLQRKALGLALKHVQHSASPKLTAHQRIDWQMLRLNCYACHDRDGKGGPEDPRAQYFMAAQSGADLLGDLSRLPPSLDRAGWRLTESWTHRVLHGDGGAVRPYLAVRMPDFGQELTAMLPAALAAADKPESPPDFDLASPVKAQDLEQGRQLMGTKGLGCVTCHGLKGQKPPGMPAMNLDETLERLNPTYFKALLLDPAAMQMGTPMPPVFVGRKHADEEIRQLWLYLKDLRQQPLPEGLLKATN